MKLLITGDWHIDNHRPANRTDDYFETQFQKVLQITAIAQKHDCDFILQPGDFFNSFRASDFLKQYYIENLQDVPTILTVFGQHDLRFHSSDKENTPLKVLEAAGIVSILNYEDGAWESDDNVYFYGSSWGEDIPEKENKKGVHIFLMHKLILKGDEKFSNDDCIYIENLYKLTDFDVIVCGDNHQSFSLCKKKRFIYNVGSLMRSRIDQAGHKPCVYLFDTNKMISKQIFLTVKPFEEVMDIDKAIITKERNERLESFIQKLTDKVEIDELNFANNMAKFMEENPISEPVKSFIEEVLQ